MKTTITTTCDLSPNEAEWYVQQLPTYEKVEGNIIEITDVKSRVFKFKYENNTFKYLRKEQV